MEQSPSDRTVLLIEDDPAVADTLSDLLEDHGYGVWRAETGADARALVERGHPDLIVLDLGLPDVDGLVLCSSLKASSDAPIIICSAAQDTRDRVLGLKLGADDFIGKPFDIYEFEARVEAIMRRHSRPIGHQHERPAHSSRDQFQVGHLFVDTTRRRVTIDGKSLPLTPTEYRLLVALASHPGEILSRDELAREVWGYPDGGSGRTIDVHIRRLRVKLASAEAPAPSIVSQRGYGYGLLDETAADAPTATGR